MNNTKRILYEVQERKTGDTLGYLFLAPTLILNKHDELVPSGETVLYGRGNQAISLKEIDYDKYKLVKWPDKQGYCVEEEQFLYAEELVK